MVFNGVFRGLIGSNGNHYGFHGFFHEILMIIVALYFLDVSGSLRRCSGRQKMVSREFFMMRCSSRCYGEV